MVLPGFANNATSVVNDGGGVPQCVAVRGVALQDRGDDHHAVARRQLPI